MQWRRICVDVDYSGNVLGGSVELYDDTTAGANAVLVASGEEVRHCSPPLAFTWLESRYTHDEIQMELELY